MRQDLQTAHFRHPWEDARTSPSALECPPVTTLPKIALVVASLEIVGGHGVHATTLMSELRRHGADVRLLPINPPFPRGLRWARRIPYLRTLLTQALYLPRLRRLREIAGCTFSPPRTGRSSSLLRPRSWRAADEIVVPSRYLAQVFRGHGYAAREIENVVDLSRFRYRERASLRP